MLLPTLPLPSPITLLQRSMTFYRKHAVLNTVTLLFFILPMWMNDILISAQNPKHPLWGIGLSGFLERIDRTGTALFIIQIGLGLIVLWGNGCAFVVARRLLESKAGRARSSLKSVRREAWSIFPSLLLTMLLRGLFIAVLALIYAIPVLIGLILSRCIDQFSLASFTVSGRCAAMPFAFLPLSLPAILYALATSFAGLIVVIEGKTLTQAFRRSIVAFKSRFSGTLFRMIGTALLLFIPVELLRSVLESMGSDSVSLSLTTSLIANALRGLAIVIFLLTTVELYGVLRNPE